MCLLAGENRQAGCPKGSRKPRFAETKLSKLGVYGGAAFTAATLPVHSAQPRYTAVSLKVGVFKGESQLTIRPPPPATQTHKRTCTDALHSIG